MSSSVAAQQRFKRNNPCPVCGGGTDDPQGQGVRCYGFLSSDGDYAHCTREDHAGNLLEHTDGTYVHRLVGDCRCGDWHDARPQPRSVAPKHGRGQLVREDRFEARDPDGTLAAIKIRREFADGSKSFFWQQPNGTMGLNGRSSAQMPLYGVETVGEARTVIITEGEKARDALAALGLPVVGTMTGANVVPSDDSLRPIADKSTLIPWPDNDDAGRSHMHQIAERLSALGASDIRILSWPDAPIKGDAADFIGPQTTVDDVRQLARNATRWAPSQSSQPIALPTVNTPSANGWPAPVDEAAFHGLAGDIVRAIEPTTEADPVALLLNFLAAIGNAVGYIPHWRVGAAKHGLRINPVFVGPTSKGRKGTGWNAIRPLLALADGDWHMQRIVSGLSSGEGLIWAVRDPIMKMEPITDKGKIVDYQEVMIDAGIDDKRLFIIEEEFAATLKVMGRESNILSAVARQAWDSGFLRTLTKNNPAQATDAHITIVGHITQSELLRYLDNTEAGNGFANRFIWLSVKRSKILPDGGQLDYVTMTDLAAQIKTVLDTSKHIGLIERDDDAAEMWRTVYADLSEGGAGLMGAVTSRAEAQVMRLAAIYAVLDETPTITTQHLEAALAIWDYSEASARFIFGDTLGDPDADAILQALRTNSEMSQTDISTLVFGRNVSASRIQRALSLLASAGKVNSRQEKSGVGRPVTMWSAD